MHGHHCLAGAGTTQNAGGPIELAFDQATLRGVQKDTPLLEWCIEHAFEFAIVFDDKEGLTRFWRGKSSGEVVGWQRCASTALKFTQDFIDRVTGGAQKQCVVSVRREADPSGIEIGFCAE
jgi:hypothetical protein